MSEGACQCSHFILYEMSVSQMWSRIVFMSLVVVAIFLDDVGNVFVQCETLSEGYIVTKAEEVPTKLRPIFSVQSTGRLNLSVPLNSQQKFRLATNKKDTIILDVYEPAVKDCDNVVKISYDGGKTGKEKCTYSFSELGHPEKVKMKQLTLASASYSLNGDGLISSNKSKSLSCGLRTHLSKSNKNWHVIDFGIVLEKNSSTLKKPCMNFVFHKDIRLLVDAKSVPGNQKNYKWIIIVGVISFAVVAVLICASCCYCITKRRAKELAAQEAAIEQIERTRTLKDSEKPNPPQ